MWKNRLDLQILAVLIIVAALLMKEYPTVGYWLTVSVMAYYLISHFTKVLKIVRKFKNVNGKNKVTAVIYFIIFILLLNSVLADKISHILLIILFGIEIYISDNNNPS
ncbi:MAG: hypothetical protein LUF90_04950 [Rikenellaceae bacterium]|nr:hypothetical protein [Rikenellaceae bacterium]